MKKGFTLIELIGVITLLGILVILIIPSILNLVKNKENELEDASNEILYKAANLYISKHDDYDLISGNVYCISLNELVDEKLISSPFINPVTGEEVSLDKEVEVKVINKSYVYNFPNSCSEQIVYSDNTGANMPELYDKMIPIKYNGSNWVYANVYSNWYDYSNKQWANAVILNENVSKNVGDVINESDIALWYVWIPRYKYTIFNGNNESVSEQLISVTFERNTNTTGTVICTDNTDGSETCSDVNLGSVTNGSSTYTHPAFTFGNNDLTGFWVGKFEVSTTDSTCNSSPSNTNCNKVSTIKVIPNVSSLRYTNVSNFFNSIQGIVEDYDLTGVDSHMIKNMEWGAVAYLKQSIYGLGTTDITINDSSSYYTGGGINNAYKTNVSQSTTGNIYGVYDMSGGSYEFAMGNMLNSSNAFYASNSGFTTALDSKYYDTYKYDTSNGTRVRGKLGDATKETLKTLDDSHGGWYSDDAFFPYSSATWFVRGGSYEEGSGVGLFKFSHSNGSGYLRDSTRAVIVSS